MLLRAGIHAFTRSISTLCFVSKGQSGSFMTVMQNYVCQMNKCKCIMSLHGFELSLSRINLAVMPLFMIMLHRFNTLVLKSDVSLRSE